MEFVFLAPFFSLMATGCLAQFAPLNARVILAGRSTVSGILNLTESAQLGGVRITGRVTGLTPGNHGFHVHEFGDVFTKGCDSTGPHFDTKIVFHGAPEDEISQRHAGDLGNIEANSRGIAIVNIVDRVISLSGPSSILGRAFIIHAGEDDLGRGNNEGSTKTGNAGARLACGIVALVP